MNGSVSYMINQRRLMLRQFKWVCEIRVRFPYYIILQYPIILESHIHVFDAALYLSKLERFAVGFWYEYEDQGKYYIMRQQQASKISINRLEKYIFLAKSLFTKKRKLVKISEAKDSRLKIKLWRERERERERERKERHYRVRLSPKFYFWMKHAHACNTRPIFFIRWIFIV